MSHVNLLAQKIRLASMKQRAKSLSAEAFQICGSANRYTLFAIGCIVSRVRYLRLFARSLSYAMANGYYREHGIEALWPITLGRSDILYRRCRYSCYDCRRYCRCVESWCSELWDERLTSRRHYTTIGGGRSCEAMFNLLAITGRSVF